MGSIPEALACGRAAARQFGIDLPEQPEQVRALLQREIQIIRERTAAIGIEKLLDLPPMQDPATIALMGSDHALPAGGVSERSGVVRAALLHDGPAVARARQLRAVGARVRLVRGACLSSVLREYEDAYRFAKLGVDLAHKLDETSMLSGVYFLFGDVRVALGQARRREHRPVSASGSLRLAERRSRARRLQRRAPVLAPAVPRHAARRAARGRGRRDRERCIESADSANPEFLRPRARADRLAARRAAATATRSATAISTRPRRRPRSRRAAIARSRPTGS